MRAVNDQKRLRNPFVEVSSLKLSVFLSSHSKSGTPLPKPDTAKKKETTDIVHKDADNGTGETVRTPEVFGVNRTLNFGKDFENDGRPGQNLVPE